jgi:hypothetical protein
LATGLPFALLPAVPADEVVTLAAGLAAGLATGFLAAGLALAEAAGRAAGLALAVLERAGAFTGVSSQSGSAAPDGL